MDKPALLQRLSDIEWDDFEVKKSSHDLPANVWETVSAFSNTSGGWLVLGVTQTGKTYEITGLTHPAKIEQDLTSTLRSRGKFNILINPECKSSQDYFSPMRPRIRVFTNRIEFENPGTLPRPLKELMKVDVSVLRNPVLAKLFRVTKLCENAGYGIDKMLVWKKETRRNVLIESSIDMTKVTFMLDTQKPALASGEATIGKQPENAQTTHGKHTENTQETSKKHTRNTQETSKKSQEIKNRIMAVLEKDPAITRLEMGRQLKITEGSLLHHLRKMRKQNIIRHEGATKAGRWIIISAQPPPTHPANPPPQPATS